ncbi:MAG: hypothetical protein IJS62_04715 [Bacteroidales bacterium]|nr:hypothetical protein [Bacteroidales bacterium]
MKRIALIAALAAIAMSCEKRDAEELRISRIANLCDGIITEMSDGAVNAAMELSIDKSQDFFSEGFDLNFVTEGGMELHITKDASRDSTWTVNCERSRRNLTFTSCVRLLPSKSDDLRQWTWSGEGVYDEDNGYTCEISSRNGNPVLYYWKRYTVEWPKGYSYSLLKSGNFTAVTLYRGKDLNRCELHYNDGNYTY